MQKAGVAFFVWNPTCIVVTADKYSYVKLLRFSDDFAILVNLCYSGTYDHLTGCDML